MSDIQPAHLIPVPFLASTENGPLPGYDHFVGQYRVRRVPYPMLLNGEPVASIVHELYREAVVADPTGAEVDVERTELAERAFHAGAHAMWAELVAAGVIVASRLPRSPTSSPSGLASNARDYGPVHWLSGCYRVRLAYPDRVDPRHRQARPRE